MFDFKLPDLGEGVHERDAVGSADQPGTLAPAAARL